MTQDVQPLTWQKRTNLEEHQQFFSKINEIIDNLAPTVEEAEAAIAQATQAIADANAAIATANAASAAADAAAQSAQTAAATVAGYNTRLTAVEGEAAGNTADITDLQDRMGTAEGNITSLGTRMSTAETKNNQQDTAIAALQAADGQNVKINAINDYAFGLTGEQVGTGDKQISNSNIRVFGSGAYGFVCKSRWFDSTMTGYSNAIPAFIFLASDNVEVGRVELLSNQGVFMIRAKVLNHDGTTKTIELIRGDN